MADVFYVRNTRPNAVLIRVAGLKQTIERRGSREDTAALPGDWREDPVVATFLHRGILEEISKDTFMTLGSRPEDARGTPLRQRAAATDVNIPINNPEESRTPFLITDQDIRDSAKLRSPRPEFEGTVPTTQEDLDAIEAARKAVEAAVGQVNLPDSETEQLKIQVNELTSLVRELLAKQQVTEAEAPKTRKKASTGTKSTRAPARKKS